MKNLSEYVNGQINITESKYLNLEQIFKGRVNFGDFRKRNEFPFYILIDSKNSTVAIEINDEQDINKLMDSIIKKSKSINVVIAFDKTEKNAVEGRLIDLEKYINESLMTEASTDTHFMKSRNRGGASGWHQYTDDIWQGNPYPTAEVEDYMYDLKLGKMVETGTKSTRLNLVDFGKALIKDKGYKAVAEDLVDYWVGTDELPTVDEFNNVCIYLQELHDEKCAKEFFKQWSDRVLIPFLEKAKSKKKFDI